MVAFELEQDDLGMPYYCDFMNVGYLVNPEEITCEVISTRRIEVKNFLKEAFVPTDDSTYV